MGRKMIAIDEVSFFFRWIRASGVIAFSGTRSDLRAFDSSKDEEIIFAVFNYRDCANSTEVRHFLAFIMFSVKNIDDDCFFFFFFLFQGKQSDHWLLLGDRGHHSGRLRGVQMRS